MKTNKLNMLFTVLIASVSLLSVSCGKDKDEVDAKLDAVYTEIDNLTDNAAKGIATTLGLEANDKAALKQAVKTKYEDRKESINDFVSKIGNLTKGKMQDAMNALFKKEQ